MSDPEVQTHAAVTIANLCHKDETAQMIFGNSGAIEALVDLLTVKVVDVLEASTSALANMTSFCDRNCKAVILAGGVSKVMHVLTEAYTENVLDMDQNDEVQANAAELLSNISRYIVNMLYCINLKQSYLQQNVCPNEYFKQVQYL